MIFLHSTILFVGHWPWPLASHVDRRAHEKIQPLFGPCVKAIQMAYDFLVILEKVKTERRGTNY